MIRLVLSLFAFALLLALSPQPAHAWPWSVDMMNQPSIKPQEGAMWPFPRRSVPVTGIPTKVADRDDAEELENPIPANDHSISEGRTLFRIYCSACHGLSGRGDTPVADLMGTVDLTDPDMVSDLTDGWIFGTITFGSAIMPAYGIPNEESDGRGSNDLNVEERWHVVNYIRAGLVDDADAMAEKAEQ